MPPRNFLVSLDPSKGFPLDLRAPRPDMKAIEAATYVFGEDTVNRVRQRYHRSVVTRELLKEDLLEYDRTYALPSVRDEPSYQLALAGVRAQFTPSRKLVPLTFGGVENHPDLTTNTSPGLPYIMNGFRKKRDVLDSQTDRWHRIWDCIGNDRSTPLPDAVQYFRAQTVDDPSKDKIRSTWGYPLDVVMEEGRYFFPYMEWMKETHQLPIGYQIEMSTGGMSYIDQICNTHRDGKFVMIDWSKFDKTVPAFLIRDAFRILYDSFDHSHVLDSENLLWPVCHKRTERRFNRMVKYFCFTPIRAHDGSRYVKSGGVPSGSMFTNLIDSIVNAIVCYYLTYNTCGRLPDADIFMGDDSFMALRDCHVNLDDMATLALEKFSMVMSVNKSYVTTNPHNVHFLGYYNYVGFPARKADSLISSFCDPERTVLDVAITFTRALGEMYATMNPFEAHQWLRVCQFLVREHSLDIDAIEDSVLENARILKHLRTHGMLPSDVVVPPLHELSGNAVWNVLPPIPPKRHYIPTIWNYDELMTASFVYYTKLKAEIAEESQSPDFDDYDASTTLDVPGQD